MFCDTDGIDFCLFSSCPPCPAPLRNLSIFRLCFNPSRSPPSPPSPSFRRSRGTGKSSLSSSPGGRLRACGPSCASAWRRGWGSIPGRWCTGTVRLRCGYAGVWSWPSSPWSAGGRACTRTASHLHGEQKMSRDFILWMVLLIFVNRQVYSSVWKVGIWLSEWLS